MKFSRLIFAFCFSIFFLFLSGLVYAQKIQGHRLEIPSEYGRLSEISKGTSGKTILLIQEAHVNYNAQKAISEILKHLIERHSLKLILVEGGWGDVNLSYLRNYADEKNRIEVAEKYLKEGKISGEEYLDITSDLDMKLWGIESPELYQENMEAFLKFHERQDTLLKQVAGEESKLESQADSIFSEPLKKYWEKKTAFQKNELSLPAYVTYLQRSLSSPNVFVGDLDSRLKRSGMTVSAYPAMQNLLSLIEGRKGFDPDKVELEKQALIRALSRVLSQLRMSQIEVMKDRKQPEEEVAFLDSLLAAYDANKKKLKKIQIGNLKRYKEIYADLMIHDSGALFEEIEKAEEAIEAKLAETEDQKNLIQQIRRNRLLKKLFSLQLTSKEFHVIRHPDPERSEGEGSQIGDSSAFGLRMTSIPFRTDDISLALSFYESAVKREEALVQNAVLKMNASDDKVIAILAGGFHAKELQEKFSKLGHSLYVISPKFAVDAKEDDQKKYFEILKYKWGQGPIDLIGGVKANETH